MENDDITIWDCPRCTGKLVRRTNKGTGEVFLGCSNFSRCRYTQPEEPAEDDLNGIADAASVWE